MDFTFTDEQLAVREAVTGILDGLTRRGALSEQDVDAALREVRRALLEADVALDVARAFTDNVKKQAVEAGLPAIAPPPAVVAAPAPVAAAPVAEPAAGESLH
jgi:signal recognition particle subunit SRP54